MKGAPTSYGWREQTLRGAAAGLVGTMVQTTIGKGEDLAFLPPWENADIAPRLIDRLAEDLGYDIPEWAEWTLGTAFHLGYGATWGAIYAAAHERYRPHPVVGGMALGGLIYAITFPRWGGAVQTRTERPPEQRTWAMEVVAISVALGYGLATALTYDRLRPANVAPAHGPV